MGHMIVTVTARSLHGQSPMLQGCSTGDATLTDGMLGSLAWWPRQSLGHSNSPSQGEG